MDQLKRSRNSFIDSKSMSNMIVFSILTRLTLLSLTGSLNHETISS
uniref:Uncharacterized protein n=1 Tax=Rhizophora mucronata TaxID=61149 RepID=A0A2P2Q5U0_RHIMU